MAILYFEGLPGAGKSYEAMATQIIPALQRGREVVAYIEGLDHTRIAEAAGLEVERVQELLYVLTRDDMRPRETKVAGKLVKVDGAWIEKTRDNALHVLDEAQNWWPNKLRATDELTQFVTEHRHRGIDVLLMGQSLPDVLALWRRRVDQRFTFEKLTALGADKSYRVTVFKGRGNDQYEKVGTSVKRYDAKYFGTYKSHVSDDTNTATYTDSRVVVWKGATFKYGAMACVLLLVFGVWKTWAFFHQDFGDKGKPATQVAVATGSGAGQGGLPSAQTATQRAEGQPDRRSPQERYLADLATKSRIRLSGLMESKGRITGVVEWLDGNTRVIERLSLDTLRDLGVAVLVTGPSVRLTLGDWAALATMWPVEAEGRVSEYRNATIRPSADGGLPPSVDGRSGAPGGMAQPSGLTIIDAPRREPAAPLEKQPERNVQQKVPAGSKWAFNPSGV